MKLKVNLNPGLQLEYVTQRNKEINTIRNS